MAKAKDDGIYWVVSKRASMFGWEPVFVFKSKTAADEERMNIEADSLLSYRAAKVTRVTLES